MSRLSLTLLPAAVLLAGCGPQVAAPTGGEPGGPRPPAVVRAAGPANGSATAPALASAGAVADQLPKEGLALPGLAWDVFAVALSADGKSLVTAGGHFSKSELKGWGLPGGKSPKELKGHLNSLHAAALASATPVLASGDDSGYVLVRSLGEDKELFNKKATQGYVYSVALTADGKTLAAGCGMLDFGTGKDSGEVKVWDVATGQARDFKGHERNVLGVALTADGKTLASGSSDRTVRLWDVANGKELRKLEGHTDGVNSVAVSADGKVLASGGKDKLVILWDLNTGKPAHTLKGHTGEVSSVALSADGKLLASGGADKTVRLWDTASGKEVATVKAPDEVLGVALTPDGKVLAAGGRGKSAKVWSVAAVRK
jgi:WD40 repeat protein